MNRGERQWRGANRLIYLHIIEEAISIIYPREAEMNATDAVEIGSTGLQVTRLGLGGVALSGAPPSTNPDVITTESQAIDLIHHAIDMGVRYLDTAPMYGIGESEKRFGKALNGVPRDSFALSTKVGRVLKPVEHGSAQLTWEFDFSRQGVFKSFEDSLERLGLESVDILYIHDPDNHYPQAITQAFPVLMELRARGLVKAIGAGMNQWQMELQFAKEGDFDCFLLAGRYTLLDQAGLAEFLPLCQQKNISVVAGGPYNSGILATDVQQDSTFNYVPAAPEVREKAVRIKEVCDRHEVSLKAAALQFILAHPAIASVIPGARSIEELDENARLIEAPIPGAMWAELKQKQLIEQDAPTPEG